MCYVGMTGSTSLAEVRGQGHQALRVKRLSSPLCIAVMNPLSQHVPPTLPEASTMEQWPP